MKELDEDMIKKALKGKINIPNGYINAIYTAFDKKEKRYNFKYDFVKVLATTCSIMILTAGIAFAGYNIYQGVWIEPKLSNEKQIEEEINSIKVGISEEEKQNFTAEDEAKKKFEFIMNELGYGKNEVIKKSELIRGYDKQCSYVIQTNSGKYLNLNPENLELLSFIDKSITQKQLNSDNINKEKAIEIAHQTYQKLNMDILSEGYEVADVIESDYISGNINNKMWKVKFCKKYNGNFNMNDYYSITFLVNEGVVKYNSITGRIKDNFENNPILISEENAINIATQKENEFSTLKIANVDIELSIEKMNLFIFCLENNIDNKDGQYQIDDMTRNVWVVKIKHEKENAIREYDVKSVREKYDKKYYIDVTTGEIIGGEQMEIFQN